MWNAVVRLPTSSCTIPGTSMQRTIQQSTPLRRQLLWGMTLLWPSVVWAQTGAGSGTHTTPSVLPEVTVVDTTPLHGDGIDRDKVPTLGHTPHQKIIRE